MDYLLVNFSNENGAVDARIGWSNDGFAFADNRKVAYAILTDIRAEELGDKSPKQLMKHLQTALTEQAQDDETTIRGEAHKARNYIGHALFNDTKIVVNISAESETVNDELTLALYNAAA